MNGRGGWLAAGLVLIAAALIGLAIRQPVARNWLFAWPTPAPAPFRIANQEVCPGDQVLTFRAAGPVDWLRPGDIVALALLPAPATPAATSVAAATPPAAASPGARLARPATPIHETPLLAGVTILGIEQGEKEGAALIFALPDRYDLTTLGRLSGDTTVRPLYVAQASRPGRAREGCGTP